MDVAVQFRVQNILWAIGTAVFIIVGSLLIGHAARLIARWRGLTEARQRQVFWGFFFASPWLIGFFIFVLGPALASLYYSFTGYRLGDEQLEWVGLDNYRQFITGSGAYGRRFKSAMFNSFYYAIIGVPLQILAALGMAVLLNQAMKGIRVFRMIFYMPVILAGGPAILLAWRYMLASNGGFINVSLQGLAENFFLFDWLYRGFIFVVEGFNGFYTGLSRGDPIGPLKYTLPAVIAVILLLNLVRGDWSPGKKEFAQKAAEIIGAVVAFLLVANGIVAEPIDPSWTFIISILAMTMIVVNARRGNMRQVRLWQWGTLLLFALGILLTLVAANENPAIGGTSTYLLTLLVAAAPIALSLIRFDWGEKRKRTMPSSCLLLVAIVLFSGLLFIDAIPGQLDGGRITLPLRYVTMQSALEHPDDADYLSEVYPVDTMSSLWFYSAIVVIMVAVIWLGNRGERYEKHLRYLLIGSLIFFTLFMLGSFIDGVRYFRAFDDIALATGRPNYHFALFHSATNAFPESNRVPLWMSNELWTKPALILITMWSSGAGMLIFLAALKGVPQSLYEAAEVDGANRIQKFFKITLPMISPAMFYNVVIGVIAALQTFEAVYILQTPENVESIQSAAFFLYERTFRQLAIGQGASVSWILAVIIVGLTVMQFRYSNWVHYEV